MLQDSITNYLAAIQGGRGKLFITKNFETSFITTDPARNPSIISRVRNAFIEKYNAKGILPKWVAIILEGDLIDSLPSTKFGMSEAYGTVLDYIMSGFDAAVQSIQEGYPLKAKKFKWPFFLWIEPSLNVNYQNDSLRSKFIKSLHIVSQMHDNTITLPLKNGWSEEDNQLFNWHRQKFTQKGLIEFWNAVDQTIKFADMKLMRNHGPLLKDIFQKEKLEKDAISRVSVWELKQQRRRDHRYRVQFTQIRSFFERKNDENTLTTNGFNRRRLGEQQQNNEDSGRTNSQRREDRTNRKGDVVRKTLFKK